MSSVSLGGMVYVMYGLGRSKTHVRGLEGPLQDVDCVVLCCDIAQGFRSTVGKLDLVSFFMLRSLWQHAFHTISRPRAVS